MIMAQAPTGDGGAAPGQAQGCQQMLMLILPMVLIFYFLIIRPQQKQQKKHKELIGALKKGDKVITNSGIFGTITGFSDIAVTLEVAKNTHIRILRSHIAGLQPQPGEQGSNQEPVVPGADKK
jgi:preprotein translocase subunit YajC